MTAFWILLGIIFGVTIAWTLAWNALNEWECRQRAGGKRVCNSQRESMLCTDMPMSPEEYERMAQTRFDDDLKTSRSVMTALGPF